MGKIKYNLTPTWMAPNIPTFASKEDCETAIVDVKECQGRLTGDLRLLDLTNKYDHFKLFAFINVSFQLMQMLNGLESVLRYMSGETLGGTHANDVYTAPRAHEQEQARGVENHER